MACGGFRSVNLLRSNQILVLCGLETSMLKFHLLGSFLLTIKEKPIRLPTRKVESLLAYLVLHREVQSRERIASMFWGDSPDELARRSLRTALSSMRKELGEDFILSD